MIIIYADILFLINFIMMLFVLFCMRLFLKAKSPFLLCAAGAFTASLGFCIITLLKTLSFLNNPLGFCALALLTIYISFLPKSIKELLKLFMILTGFTFFFGGAVSGIINFINSGKNFTENFEKISLPMLAVCILISYIMIRTAYSIYKNTILKKRLIYTVKIEFKGKKTVFSAIGDTGNTLCDHITGNRVIVTEYSVLSNLMPTSKPQETTLFDYAETLGKETSVRLIPYKSLGNKNGLMLCFLPDRIFIDNKEYKNILIGITFMKLSDNGSFKGLINTEILNTGEVNKNADKAA